MQFYGDSRSLSWDTCKVIDNAPSTCVTHHSHTLFLFPHAIYLYTVRTSVLKEADQNQKEIPNCLGLNRLRACSSTNVCVRRTRVLRISLAEGTAEIGLT